MAMLPDGNMQRLASTSRQCVRANPALKAARRLLACGALLALQSCGAFQLAYNNADVLVRFQADRYLDLNSAQVRWLSGQLVAQHGWHRKTQLPKYGATLHDLARRVSTCQ